MTNFEKIKQMSVEEMADFLYHNIHEDECGELFIEDELMFSEKSVINWLESEADNG